MTSMKQMMKLETDDTETLEVESSVAHDINKNNQSDSSTGVWGVDKLKQFWNFSAGPSVIPKPVLEQAYRNA